MSARIFWGRNLDVWADCTVLNISPGGAKVALPEIYDPPVQLVLLNLETGTAHDAVRKWRRPGGLGVSFVQSHQLSGPVAARLSGVQEIWRSLAPSAS